MRSLPIDEVMPEVKGALSSEGNAVVVAPPGSGKTTRIPLALLSEPWIKGQRILMLEPRRLAARAAARYMAAYLGEEVGQTVGYRVRLDTCIGADTKIEVITEGVLTRMLQTDQTLEGVGLIIFDEFHERSLHADIGLALALEVQAVLRADLRLLVMSATLEAEPVAAILGDCPVICGSGQSFPVETHYLDRKLTVSAETAVAQTVFRALKNDDGDILAFLPGAAEIRRVQAELLAGGIEKYAQVALLFGNLPPADQEAALLPSSQGKRKVVLSTAIAETSLTVEGVSIVIDSGLMRVPAYLPRTGLSRLETIRVTRAAADQRRGRAGRLRPGVCYRLWTKQEDAYLEPKNTPEILAADLTPLALELAAWGVAHPNELFWLDSPPVVAYLQARSLLVKLGALETDGAITDHGRQMAETGLHPRLAHMVLKSIDIGFGALGCELAAILSERDFFRGNAAALDADLRLRVEAIRNLHKYIAATDAAGRRIKTESDRLKKNFNIAAVPQDDIEACGLALAFAYPDRIGQLRGDGRFLLESGRGAVIAESQALAQSQYIVAAELDGQGSDSRIFLAAPLQLEQIKQYFSQQIESKTQVAWDTSYQAVRARTYECLGALVLKENPCNNPNESELTEALLKGISLEGLEILPWSKAARQFRQRLLFAYSQEDKWPDVSDKNMLATLNDWLGPHVYGIASRAELAKINLLTALESLLTWSERQELDRYAPAYIVVPSGQRIAIDYSSPESPVLAVRLQEVFGLKATPCIALGKVPLTLHLLSPAYRPVQVTRDLSSFWANTYFEVKKDLKGRYPKHYWPDDPATAVPTNRTRPKP